MVSSVPAPLQLRALGATEVGRVRPHNEDRFVIREDLQLFVVADGAGGHAAGDVAASLAILSVVNYLEATRANQPQLPPADRFGIPREARWLARAVHKANRDVHEAASTTARKEGMGTTVVAALFVSRTGHLHVAHVGDSRCYRWRDGHCEQLTQDHSLARDLLEEHPEVEDRVLRRLPRNVVTRALGMAAKTRVSVGSFEVAALDRYLLCSDGLSSFVPPATIAGILGEPRPTGAIVQLLLNAADDAGAPDNVTAIVVECPEADPDSLRRRAAREDAERRAADDQARDATSPEILLVGIEDLDLYDVLADLAGPEPDSTGDGTRPPGSPNPERR
jgi:serine/threonine protein phosphatase PrpC